MPTILGKCGGKLPTHHLLTLAWRGARSVGPGTFVKNQIRSPLTAVASPHQDNYLKGKESKVKLIPVIKYKSGRILL